MNSCLYVQGLHEIQYMNINNKLRRLDANKANEMFKNEYMAQDESITPQNFSSSNKRFQNQYSNSKNDNDHSSHMDNQMNIRSSLAESKN